MNSLDAFILMGVCLYIATLAVAMYFIHKSTTEVRVAIALNTIILLAGLGTQLAMIRVTADHYGVQIVQELQLLRAEQTLTQSLPAPGLPGAHQPASLPANSPACEYSGNQPDTAEPSSLLRSAAFGVSM